MYLFIFVLLIGLFVMILRQWERIKKLELLLNIRSKDIASLKDQLRELKTNMQSPPRTEDVGREPVIKTDVSMPVKDVPIPSPPVRRTAATPTTVSEHAAPAIKYQKAPGVKKTTESKPRAAIQTPGHGINWENFLGAKLFAWVGGFSLFIAFAFLLKYSFDHNLISPAVRVAIGFIGGAGLVAGGIHLKRKTYEVTSQTLCATGIVILYTSSFAANSIYHFFSSAVTVFLMSVITAGAFALAAGTQAKVVAVLGMVGGFLTPILLPVGQDQPFTLFSYITLLNIGLFSVAFYRKWNFLFTMGAIGTVLIQLWWSLEFFTPGRVYTAIAVYLWFNLLYCAAFRYGKKMHRTDGWLAGPAVALPFVTFMFALSLIYHHSIGMRPGVIFSCLLGADLCLLAVVFPKGKLNTFYTVAGGFVFFLLSQWILFRMTQDLLIWALSVSLVFAILHSVVPMIAARTSPNERSAFQTHLFPLLALFIILIPILQGAGGGWLVWFFVLILNGIILALALVTVSSVAIMAATVITGLVILGWIVGGPAAAPPIDQMLILIGAFAIFFSVIGTSVLNRVYHEMRDRGWETSKGGGASFGTADQEGLFFLTSAVTSALPFILLVFASSSIEMANPAPILGLGLLLCVITFGVALWLKMPQLYPVALGGLFLLEAVLHLQHFNSENANIFLGLYILATALFFILPFYFRRNLEDTVLPWACAALTGPLHFFLVYDVVRKVYPNDFMGLLPAAMAVPFFFGLTFLLNRIREDSGQRNAILAWFGGSTLFFITLIFPLQFDHQWLTVGWALEGAALIWLFRRIPHPGLQGVGIVLLVITFIRLGMNPAILLHYPYSSFPIFNWYLYTYGIAVFCLMAGARMLAPPRNRAFGINVPPILYSLGTILAFFLMNIEIADLFSPGLSLKFQFTGELARGMTYSIAWALFALGLLIAGILKQLRPVRLAGIGLIGVTLIKLFFLDLSQLEQLYRIGAFVGVAVVLISASALYQKWIVRKT